MAKHRYSALVVGCAYSIGLSRLPRVLARAGCRVTVLGSPRSLARRSRYTHEFIETGLSPAEVIAGLKAHLRASPGYDLVIPGDDDSLLAMAAQCDQPWARDWLPFPPNTRAAEIATNKLAFGDAMLAAGGPYPPSAQAATLSAAADAADRLGYPVMLKAGHGYLGSFVRIVDGPADLPATFDELIPTGPLQVQKYIVGRVGCAAVLFDRGNLVSFVPAFKAECYPDRFGASCVRRFTTHPRMESICRTVGAVTRYHGFGGIDWILDDAGDLHVIEFNARPIPGYHFGPAAGVDFSKALAAMLAGQSPAPVQPRGNRSVYMYPEHLLRCVADGDYRGLCRYLPFAATIDFPWDDFRLLVEPFRKAVAKLSRVGRRDATDPIDRPIPAAAGLDSVDRRFSPADAVMPMSHSPRSSRTVA